MTYVYLFFAILSEVIATSMLKASQEFTKLVPSLVVIFGYSITFYLMTLVMRKLPIGITYALWSGLGIVLVTVAGYLLYDQKIDMPAVIGMVLIIAGIVVMQIFSGSVVH